METEWNKWIVELSKFDGKFSNEDKYRDVEFFGRFCLIFELKSDEEVEFGFL